MINSEIEDLIVKYLTKSANAQELSALAEWVADSENLQEFNGYVKTHYTITYSMNDFDPDKIKEELLEKIRKDKSINARFKVRSVLKYASIVIVCLSIGYFYQTFFGSQTNEINSKEEYITLELEDGNIKVISEDGTTKVMDAKGNVVGNQQGNQLVYGSAKTSGELNYNILKVPYGKRFQLLLSDGTKVHLNAGTTLKFPTRFVEGKERQVYLSGEAYFDVAKNEASQFIVTSEELNVEVLGTQFNVTSYPEDGNSEVVLVEGSVNLFTSDSNDHLRKNEVLLVPGYSGTLNKSVNKISVKSVVTSIYTSWIHGELVFRNMTFSNILKKMERHYNVKITNNNQELANEEFNASFGDESISKILTYLEVTYDLDVSIDEDEIVIE